MDYEVQAAVSALGYLEGNNYRKEADCLETVKDLIRYLRRDGEKRSIRRRLGESNIIESDLVPILIHYTDDEPLFDAALRLLINLTQSPALCFEGKVPQEFDGRQSFMEILNHLKRSKHGFANETFFSVLFSKLDRLLKLDWENRQEEDKIMIERLLTLIKNILSIPPADEDQRRTETDITLHDQILWAIHRSGVERLILTVAESKSERQFHLGTLEIICLMLKDHKPEEIARAGDERQEAEKIRDEKELADVHSKELAQKYSNLRRCSGRHTNFAGSYIVQGFKSIDDDKDVVAHKVVTKNDDLTWDSRKRKRKPAKNKMPLPDEPFDRKSALTVRLFLKDFCETFLERCYESFMRSVRQSFGRSERRQYLSEFYYMWCSRFCLQFSRATKSDKCLNSMLGTINVQTFHFVLTQMNGYLEMMKADKIEAVMWGKRFRNGFQTYKELYAVLNIMENSSNEKFVDNAMEIKRHIFHVDEYGEFFIDILKSYNPAALTKDCLKDIVECIHVYMKSFEIYCQVHGGEIKMQKKQKKRKRKRVKVATAEPEDFVDENDKKLHVKEKCWDSISSRLSSLVQDELVESTNDAIPFDPLAEHGFDEKVVAQIRIQESLKNGLCEKAVSFLKASRQLWPDASETFGTENLHPEDEFMLYRRIFFADLPSVAGENDDAGLDENVEDGEEEDEIVDEEFEDREAEFSLREVEFSFMTYLQRFCHCGIVTWYIWLLESFETNSIAVNHGILKLFHRIVFQLKSPASLFQARLFRVFQKLSKLPSFRKRPALQELNEFAKHFLRQFFEQASNNKKVFVEILFWKNSKEIYELENGYGTFKKKEKVKSSRKGKSGKRELNEEDNEVCEENDENDENDEKNQMEHEFTETPDYHEFETIEKTLNSQ